MGRIMRRFSFALWLGLSLATCRAFFDQESERLLKDATPAGVTAFVNANVVPMDRASLLRNQTVLVEEGKITRIGPAVSLPIPEGARRIEASGRYLMPGLTDMHVHLVTDRRDLFLYVANGVTSVRNMAGFQVPAVLPRFVSILDVSDHIRLRNEIQRGHVFGPAIFTSGQQLDGVQPFNQPWPLSRVIETAQEAQSAVQEQKKAGFDFIKIYHALKPDVYAAVIDVARTHGMKVTGHVPLKVGIRRVLEAKATMHSIEHLNGYIDHFHGRLYFPARELETYAKLTRKSGVRICPTLIVWTSWIREEDLEKLSRNENLRYVSPAIRKFWAKRIARGKLVVDGSGGTYPAYNLALYKTVARALHRERVPFLLGTDSVSPYIIPGFSIHQELALLVEVGLTPYEALQAGTVNAAEALGRSESMGTVQVGKNADLVLLSANPLADVQNFQKREGVMLRGRWYAETELQQTLLNVSRSF